MVEIRDGVVTAIVPFATLTAEPAGTVFHNGTISAAGNQPIYIGYSGTLYLNGKPL